MPRTVNGNKRCTTRAICNGRRPIRTHRRHDTAVPHWRLSAGRPSGERERMSSSSWVGRSLEPVRADEQGAAVTPPITRYTTSDCGRESAARTRFPWKQRHHCTCTAVTSQHHHPPPPHQHLTGTPVGSIGSHRLTRDVKIRLRGQRLPESR